MTIPADQNQADWIREVDADDEDEDEDEDGETADTTDSEDR